MCIVSSLAECWRSLPTEIKAALIQALGTIAAAGLAIGGLILQLKSQSSQARATILETEARKLKMQMYEEGVSVSREVSDRAIEFSTTVLLLSGEINIEIQGALQGVAVPTTKIEYTRLMQEYSAYADATLKLIYIIENRRIIDPRIIIFHDALNAVNHDTRELMHKRFLGEVMRVLPATVPDGRVLREPVTSEGLAGAKRALDEMHTRIHDAIMIMEDFNVEIQNLLLGDIFDRKVDHRKPIDPRSTVVTLDKYDEIQRMLADTPWGIMCKATEDEVRRGLEGSRD